MYSNNKYYLFRPTLQLRVTACGASWQGSRCHMASIILFCNVPDTGRMYHKYLFKIIHRKRSQLWNSDRRCEVEARWLRNKRRVKGSSGRYLASARVFVRQGTFKNSRYLAGLEEGYVRLAAPASLNRYRLRSVRNSSRVRESLWSVWEGTGACMIIDECLVAN